MHGCTSNAGIFIIFIFNFRETESSDGKFRTYSTQWIQQKQPNLKLLWLRLLHVFTSILWNLPFIINSLINVAERQMEIMKVWKLKSEKQTGIFPVYWAQQSMLLSIKWILPTKKCFLYYWWPLTQNTEIKLSNVSRSEERRIWKITKFLFKTTKINVIFKTDPKFRALLKFHEYGHKKWIVLKRVGRGWGEL